MDIRPTSEAARDYIWFGRTCLEQARRSGFGGAKAIRDGRWLVICKYTLHHATLITLSQGDFTMHPRSGRLAKLPYWNTDYEKFTLAGINGGGWAQSGDGFVELAARSPYPLVDNDHGTFVISIDGEDLEVEWAGNADDNYGNIWWSGTGDEPNVLSWRGPPSIQFPIGAEYTIPGLTMEVPGGNSVFGCFIYSDGARLCHGPAWYPDEPERTLIVGACYATDETRKRWLVAMTVTHKGSAHVLQVWRSEDTGKTWQLLNEFPSLRAAVTAFISQDGRRFVYGGQLYQIDPAISSVAAGAKIPTSVTGTRTIHGAGGYGSTYHYEGVRHLWPALSKETDGLAYTTIKEEAAFGGTGSGDTKNQTTQVPVYRGNPATGVSIIAGYDNGFVFDAVFTGSYCSVIWSGVDRYKDTRAWKSMTDGCNSNFTVSVTLLPQGVSDTYTHTAEQEDMTVSGPASATVGAQYSANHGIAPITWSISSGAISDSGQITELGCNPTITATDFCGRSASLTTNTVKIMGGPDVASLGAQYTVSNAVGPVTWSISAGSINSQTGVITGTACGTITVTATDSCGSANKVVRGVSGTWVVVETFNPGAALCTCGAPSICTIYTSPARRIYYNSYCCRTDETGSCAPTGGTIDTGTGCNVCGQACTCGETEPRHNYIYYYTISEYRC